MGGGIGMGSVCGSMADSFQCVTKPTTIKKKKCLQKKIKFIWQCWVLVMASRD